MGVMASQITSLIVVNSTVYTDADQRKHQSSASLAFVGVIHRWPMNSPHKWPVARKMFPFDDVIVTAMASQITSLSIVYLIVYSGTDIRKHQSSASLAFVWGIHRWLVNSLHKGPITWKIFPFDDVIMELFMNADNTFYATALSHLTPPFTFWHHLSCWNYQQRNIWSETGWCVK